MSNDATTAISSDPQNQNPGSKLFVVGVGESAGGLDAVERLFGNMPVDTKMAFVVVQHLSTDFESLMDELLARHTSMPIHRVKGLGLTLVSKVAEAHGGSVTAKSGGNSLESCFSIILPITRSGRTA